MKGRTKQPHSPFTRNAVAGDGDGGCDDDTAHGKLGGGILHCLHQHRTGI